MEDASALDQLQKMSALQIKILNFMSMVYRQSFIKVPDLPYPAVSPDGQYDPSEFSAWLKTLGYTGQKGQLRLAAWVIYYQVSIFHDKDTGKHYFK